MPQRKSRFWRRGIAKGRLFVTIVKQEWERAGEITLCQTCGKREGTERLPRIADREAAQRLSYVSCDECFAAVWAGEN